MRVWGITGTNGKTTTAWILAEFLKAAYVTTVEVNTLGRRFSTGYTTPPLATLKAIFEEMRRNGASDCVMEVSSHAIHQHRTGDTVFAGGAFTNLSEDHLDYHGTMEEYFRVKFSFAEQIAAASPGAPYVVCTDGENGPRMLDACRGIPSLRVIPVTLRESRFDLEGLRLVGDYNKSNVLVAAELALAAGVAREEIQRAIPALRPRWGRLEKVQCGASPADVYVDFAHTPDGLEKVLTAARGFAKGKLWVVFGAGGDRDKAKRPLMGEVVANLADRAVVTSDNPRSEDPMDIISQILAGMGARDVIVEPDRRAAIYRALAEARRGDVVLVCGKGHETTQEIAGVKHPFDDRLVVRDFEVRRPASLQNTPHEA